jgi:hypothetical protein
MERAFPIPLAKFANVREPFAVFRELRWPALHPLADLVEHGIHLLDSAVPVPGTRFRVGLDPLIGLIPVVGDVVGGAASLGVLFLAVQYRVPSKVIGIMVVNVAVDTLVGGVPVVGDVFDFVWKANERNYALLKRHRGEACEEPAVSYWLVIGGLLLAAALAVAAPLVLANWLLRSS